MTKKTKAEIQADLTPFAAALTTEAKRASKEEYGLEVDVVVMLNYEGKHAVGSNMDMLHARILMDEIANLSVHDPEVQRMLDIILKKANEIEAARKMN